MKLQHIDPKIAEAEGVIERSGLDAREIIATGEYKEVSDDTEEPAPVKEPKPAKAGKKQKGAE